MSKPTKFINAKRRGFLQGSVAAGAAAATGAASANTLAPEIEVEVNAAGKHAGYKETEKVRRYYKAARF